MMKISICQLTLRASSTFFSVLLSFLLCNFLSSTLRAEPLLSFFWRDRKRGSAEICFIIWSRRSPKSWASHSCQTGFTSASITFYEKPMVETEPMGYKENMPAKRWRKEVARKRLTCSHAVYRVFHLSDRYFRVLAHSHWSRKIFHFISLSTFADGRKRVFANNLKALGTLILSAHPSDVVTCVTTNCQVFGMNCLRFEEFKQGDPGDLSFFQ